MKFLKPGKVVIPLNGRYAGKKAVIVKSFDEGTKEHPFPHALVVGVERYPLKVTTSMGPQRIAKRSKVKPFIKVINYNHLMPTRYTFELETLKQIVTVDSLKDASQKGSSLKAAKKSLKERYMSGKNKWFFQKLRF